MEESHVPICPYCTCPMSLLELCKNGSEIRDKWGQAETCGECCVHIYPHWGYIWTQHFFRVLTLPHLKISYSCPNNVVGNTICRQKTVCQNGSRLG